ncbi:MAG: hypothetical protein JXX29_07335 [Deltaproteobacteria bacterium]|nr:hypothetical protein [Deltaproteobacteria bacterium]MBN2671468.1 hypothetical protein [Deltaproteobacteria bacterium]
MRLNSNRLFSAVLIAALGGTAGCESDEDVQRREFIQLEAALHSISAHEDPNWETNLKQAEAISIGHPRIRELQLLCVSAYKQYADGMKRLEESEKKIKALEAALENKDITNIALKHREAQTAVEATTAHLKQAETFIDQCTDMRRNLQQKLGVIVK